LYVTKLLMLVYFYSFVIELFCYLIFYSVYAFIFVLFGNVILSTS
jgi:hypothetical protein